MTKGYITDIKPSNIYYYEGRFSLGDFGLVDFPDNDDFTRSDQGLGAIFTIAPEMKRNLKWRTQVKLMFFHLQKHCGCFLVEMKRGSMVYIIILMRAIV